MLYNDSSSPIKSQIVSKGRKKFSADFQLMFRLLKMFLFIGFLVILVILFTTLHLTVGDIFQSLLAFLPTGWALLQVTSISSNKGILLVVLLHEFGCEFISSTV